MEGGNKMNIEDRLKNTIERKFGNVKTFAEKIDLPYTTVRSILQRGVMNAKVENVIKIADGLNMRAEDLMSLDNTQSISTIYNQLIPERQAKVYDFAERQLEEQNRKVVPLFGTTAANPTELSYGDINMEDTIEINVPKKAECALVVKGDSMEPEYQNGDIVFYKSQPAVENGEMAIVEIDDDGVTLKKVYYNYDDDKVVLRSLNGKYEDRELEPERVRILGKVVK